MSTRCLDLLKYYRPLYAEPEGFGEVEVEVASAGANAAETAAPEPKANLDDIISQAMEGMGVDGEALDADGRAAVADGRKRGADGRFAPVSEAPAPGVAGPVDAAAKNVDQPATGRPAPPVQSLSAPDNWSADHKAAFAKLAPEGQKFLLERHGEIQADYTRKTQEIAEFRRSAEPLVQAVEPFSKYLQSLGRNPADALRVLLGTEYGLRTGKPEQKAGIFAQLAVDYQVPLAAVHQLIQQGQVRQPVPLNPQTHQQIQKINERFDAFEQRAAQQQQQEQGRAAASEIESFRTAKDASGQPKYPQYERVKGSMADWFASSPKELEGKSLSQMLHVAYERFGKPIDDSVKEQVTARQKQATEATAAAVAKARGAASVRSGGSTPRGSATSRDLDAIINGAFAKTGFQG